MNSRVPYDPLTDFTLSGSGGFLKQVNGSPSKKVDIPFYAPQKERKTSAEIIQEAKANMTRPGSFPAIDDSSMRAAVRTVDTKRPFTPRQTDRRLYSGSTNHVARPPSSFRLLPLPEEDCSRPATGVRLSPLSAQDTSVSPSDSDNGKLPKLLPQLSVSPQSAKRKTSRDNKRQQFRASSLTDVLEVVEQDRVERVADGRKIHSSPKERGSDDIEQKEPVALIQKIHEEVSGKKVKKKSIGSKKDREETAAIDTTNEKPAKSAEELILLNLLSDLKDPQMDKNEIKSKLDNLYKFIVDCNNPKFFQKRKGDLIKILCQYVDTDSPQILILLVQILLSINVRKQNLATAYKLIFKVAREDENDNCFLTGDALELLINSIGGACPVNDSEALVYGYGALKFLTMNPQTREKLRKMGILDLVLLHLKLICEAKQERKIPDETSHVLFQLTGVIRNLVNDVPSQRLLVSMGGITHICRCLRLFITDLDVVCNIARTLSVMSSDDDACTALTDNTTFASTAVDVLKKYPGRQDIVVRLTYCLGNLMAKCDEARPFLSPESDSGVNNMDTLMDLLQSYRKKEARPASREVSMAMKMESEDDHGSSGNSEDVVIKIIRVVANMSINGEVGQQVASMPEVYENLTDILATRTINENEELILSTLATLNNLTYYPVEIANKDDQDVNVFKRIESYIDCLNIEAQIESSRVLGNLTRSKVIRDQLAIQPTWNAIVNLLGSEQRDLVYTSVGVIVNMMSDFDKRKSLKSLGGVSSLIKVLKDCGVHPGGYCDWLLASLTCQAIWNYSIDSTNLFDCMDKEEISELEAILVEYLDEDTIFGSQEELSSEQIPRYHEWEEFAKVGVNLLERLESFLEPLGPVDGSENDPDENISSDEEDMHDN